MRLFKRRTPIWPLVEEFSETIRRRSGGTSKSWTTDINRLRKAVELMGAQYAQEVRPASVARALSAKEAEGCSPRTLNNFREIAHRFLQYLIDEKGIEFRETGKANPAARVRRRKEPAPQIRYLTLNQLYELLDGLSPDRELRATAAVMGLAGLRRGEVCRLTKEDVDLPRGLILVRAKTIDGRLWQPKNRENRSVPVSARLREELSLWEPPRGVVWHFPSPRGVRWNEDNFSRAFRRQQRELGVSWTALDLRHTFGTQLAMGGVSLYKISKLMGNSPDICRKHYAFLMPDQLKEEVEFADEIEVDVIPAVPEEEPEVAGNPPPEPSLSQLPTRSRLVSFLQRSLKRGLPRQGS